MSSESSLLAGEQRSLAIGTIVSDHYTHGVPSGKTHYFRFRSAIISYSIPANKNIARYILGYPSNVWELTRLYAPDGHEPNLLTMAISASFRHFRALEKSVEAVVSYADPNVGHSGGVYRAASWIYTGQSEDGRYYVSESGQVVSRRKFHSGKKIMTKSQIEAMGYRELKMPGKHRFVRPISRKASREIAKKFSITKD